MDNIVEKAFTMVCTAAVGGAILTAITAAYKLVLLIANFKLSLVFRNLF